jgi:predicted phosphodiesterase
LEQQLRYQPRFYAVSDIHVDYAQNMDWVMSLSTQRYLDDVLIVAGDVSDNLARLEQALCCLRARFARVFFVAGNHEMWIRRDECADSWEKYHAINRMCRSIGVDIEAKQLGAAGLGGAVWVVPLRSWYVGPEEGDDTLYIDKPGEDPTLSMWADKYFVRWPDSVRGDRAIAHLLLTLNPQFLAGAVPDAPVITFSHFLPRRDLIFSTDAEAAANPGLRKDAYPEFNFSRVAGCALIDVQLRQLGASVHVYGHQHRNRDRMVDGVRYVSNCLGYPAERNGDADPHHALVRIW